MSFGFEQVDDSAVWRLNLWMKILGKDIPVHTYLIHDGPGWHLIDTGQPEDYPVLLDALDRKLNGGTLAAVYITHAHLDHAGGLQQVMNKYPEAAVYIHDGDVPYIFAKDNFRGASSDECCTPFAFLKCCLRELRQEHRPSVSQPQVLTLASRDL